MEIKDFLVRAIKIGIILVFLTPLVLGPFGLNMSEYPKAVFFRSVIEIIFVLYIFLILLNPGYIPKKSFLLFSVILFDAILMIASLSGINFYRSFFGEMQRGEGIILHLHLLVFFIILMGLFRKKEDWLWLFKATVIVSALSSIAAIFQQLKISSFYNVEVVRMSGTFSNPDLFGSYTVLSIFLIIFLLAAESKKNWKILWISLIILDFYALILSGVKAAWVGFAFGIVLIYILNYKNLNHKKRICSLLIILSVSVLALFLPQLIQKFHLEDYSFSKSVLGIYNFEISNRLGIWKISLAASKDRPFLGWGVESFSFVYDKYLKSGYSNGMYFDRPHSKILEILEYSGIIGIISYLLIFAALFYLIFKYAKLWNGYNNKPGTLFCSIIFAFFVSGFVQNLVAFDHIGTYILFFLAMAFVNNNFSNQKRIKEISRPLRPGVPSGSYPEKIILVASVAVFMIFVLYQVNIKPTMAAMNFNESIKYERSDPAIALAGYKNGISMNTLYDNDLVMAFADRSIFLLENGFGANIGDKAVGELLKVKPVLYGDIMKKDERPNNLYEIIIRTDEWSYIVRKDPSYLGDMEKDINQAITFNPHVPTFYQLQGEMKILQDKNDEGEKDIKKGCVMDTSGCNSNEAEAYKLIGIAYYKKGDMTAAIKNFQNALDVDYNSRKKGLFFTLGNGAQFADSVAIMYYTYLKDFEGCKKVYKRAIEVYPEYEDIFLQHLNQITADYEKNK